VNPIRTGRERPVWFVEGLLLVGGYVAFGLVRSAVDRGNPAATDNARFVQRLEQTLHVAVEYPFNHAVLEHPIAVYGTGYFYRLCILAVSAVLIWLYLRHPARYRYLRNVLVVATLIDLPLVWLFPESPPRFAQNGIVDYIADHDIVGGASLRDPNAGLNLLAAMPSMHIAWTSWSAYAVFVALRRRHPRESAHELRLHRRRRVGAQSAIGVQVGDLAMAGDQRDVTRDFACVDFGAQHLADTIQPLRRKPDRFGLRARQLGRPRINSKQRDCDSNEQPTTQRHVGPLLRSKRSNSIGAGLFGLSRSIVREQCTPIRAAMKRWHTR